MLARYVDAYCEIASYEPGKPIFIANDSSECTLFRIDGLKTITSEDDAGTDAAEYLGVALSSILETPGYALTISFEVSSNIEDEVKPLFKKMEQAANQKGLDLSSIIRETEKLTIENGISIKVLLACWTMPGASYKAEISQARKDATAVWQDSVTASALTAQRPNLLLEPINSPHKAFVDLVSKGLDNANIQWEILGEDGEKNVRHDLIEVRKALLFHETPDDWSPMYAGLRRYPEAKKSFNSDVSEFFAPRVSRQMMASNAQGSSKKRCIEFGGRSYAVMQIDLFPREPRPFTDLFRLLRGDGKETTPFRVTFQFEGGAFTPGLMQVIAGFASLTSGTSKNIFNTNKQILDDMRRGQGAEYVKTRILASTWREPDEPDAILERRRALLMRALTSWGNAQVADVPSNMMRSLCETVPGMTVGARSGKATFVPVGDSFRMLPFRFAAPVFNEGESIFLTPDGRLSPYKAFSPKMQYWFTTIFATPGSGKSVLMNRLNFEFVSYHIGRKLPFLLCIDLGVSSSGFIRMMQEALPPEEKHLASYIRPVNSAKFAVNPFDLGLGRRKPLARESSYVRDFILSMIDTPEQHKPEMKILVSEMCRQLYQIKSDLEANNQANAWEAGVDANVDAACQRHGVHLVNGKTRWWTIVDELMVKGDETNAIRAQRYAVPRLQDSSTILAQFQPREGQETQFTPEAVRLARQSLQAAIEQYPMFGNTTKMDLGVSRIAAIDLNDVAQRGETPEALKNNTLMFMASRSVLVQKISGHDEEIPEMDFPPQHRDMYQEYWRRRHADMGESPKRLAMDEYHVTGGGEYIESMLLSDGREGRKWGLEIILASQFLADFKKLNKMASCSMILNQEGKETRKECKTVYGFDDAVEDALKDYVHGPQPGYGANILARFMINDSERWTIMNNRIGPTMLWALNTRREDRQVRDELYKRMSASDALSFLARRYPEGSSLNHYQKVASTMNEGDEDIFVAAKLVDGLMKEYVQG
ncbi:hypothetical protein AA14337_0012 [Acetobacter malorum DSM 14337]|uniref:Uncharacterized protein n=1 Tax=Acetobacter malorum DSM 14337 TaxID=1307910 RepID=A0ABQ0PLI8_9PROT|nr:hypothetical protein [Acetobacter malorum]KXV08699.1 hypothetical protein AD930_03550 [Acetobacter malorum]GBQ74788.1 hypothetical protein AA14337_0012 [Acetobacter malorum DSM 14337]